MEEPIYTKRNISGTRKRIHHTYSSRNGSIFKNLFTKKPKKINKKEKNQKKVSKPIIIPKGRLTEPKKRCLIRRIMLQMKYNRGDYDYVEDYYYNLTRSQLANYRESKDRDDREFYKEVQGYEDATDDVTVRRGWMTFKIGLATIMLCTSIGIVNHSIQEICALAPKEPVMITLQEANQQQIENAKDELKNVKDNSQYNFENLTYQEQIDATLRIPAYESKMESLEFKGAILRFQDQELLENILKNTFGEEYSTYSDEKKQDLRKLAYELLEDEKKEYTRDPQVLKEIAEKQRMVTDIELE